MKIPPPAGLRECADGEKFRENIKNAVDAFGLLSACFQSNETVEIFYESTGLGIFSERKSTRLPVDHAYAFLVRKEQDYHFSRIDFEALKATTIKEWAEYKPIGGLQSEKHREYVEALINDNMSHESEAKLTLHAPFLVKFDESINDQYIITSIRRRIIRIGVNRFNSTKIQSNGLIYINGSILRLDYSREIREADDIDHVLSVAKSWMATVKIENSN